MNNVDLFQKIRNVLLTGCCGFIASNLCNFLVKKYPDVNFYGIDCMNYVSRLQHINVMNYPNFKFLYGDIKDIKLISFYLKEYKIDAILHLAAESHVDNSFGNSLNFTMNNVYGTHVLLECAKNSNNINIFLHMSTDEVYGTVIDGDSDENAVFDPTNPYAASKCGAEFIVRSYGYSFNFPYVIVRCNNVYGENQYPEKLIPKFICNILKDEKCQIQGNGEAKRKFIYVSDVCNAIDVILHNCKLGDIYNIGSENETSVLQFAYTIIKLMKPNIKDEDVQNYIEYVKDRNFNDMRYSINCNKLISLGWKCDHTDFELNLRRLIKWYKDNLHLYS